MNEIFLGGGTNLTIQTSKNVELKETLYLMEGNTAVDLEVTVIANFENIPEKYHLV